MALKRTPYMYAMPDLGMYEETLLISSNERFKLSRMVLSLWSFDVDGYFQCMPVALYQYLPEFPKHPRHLHPVAVEVQR